MSTSLAYMVWEFQEFTSTRSNDGRLEKGYHYIATFSRKGVNNYAIFNPSPSPRYVIPAIRLSVRLSVHPSFSRFRSGTPKTVEYFSTKLYRYARIEDLS